MFQPEPELDNAFSDWPQMTLPITCNSQAWSSEDVAYAQCKFFTLICILTYTRNRAQQTYRLQIT